MGLKQYESNQFIKTGGTSSQYLMADGSVSTGGGGVDVGTGTANKVAKFSDSDTITDGIMTDDGTSVLVGGNLAIGIGDNDNLFHIEATDTTYDVSRAIEIDYTKNHSTTGWGASVYGIRTNVYVEGTGQNADVQGGSFSATHNGSGISYYLLGSQSNAKHEGSGNTGAIWGAFNQAKVSGSGTGTHPFVIGTNNKIDINNANASVDLASGILAVAKITEGDITDRFDAGWFQIDANQGSPTTVDANVLFLQADAGNLTASGDIRTIHSISTYPSLFAGTMETTGFIKTGGTSSQFLKADGSVDTNTYATGTIPTDFVSAANGGTFSGQVKIDSDTDTILQLNNSDDGGQYISYSRSDDRHAYVGFGGSSDNFTIMSEETGGKINLGTAGSTRVTINATGNVIATGNIEANLFSKTGGASTEFLKADGSVDSSTYSTTDTQLTTEEVQDIIGAMVDGNTENNISVTYSDGDGKLNFDNTGVDLSGYLPLTGGILTGDLEIPQYIYHAGDSNTFLKFGTDLVQLKAGGRNIVQMDEGVDPDVVELGDATTEVYTAGKMGVGISNPTDKLEVNGNIVADSFKKVGGTSAEFLKADGSVDSVDYTPPTDFVSAASGGSFGGGIVADSFTITGLSSGNSFLKANGSLDGTTYNSGAGTSGGVAIYDGTNTITDVARLQWNFISDTLTVQNVDINTDLNVAGDVDVTGNLEAEYVTAVGFKNQQIILTSNLSHTSTTTGYYNIPFNSLGESISAGEQHFFVSPGSYRLRSIIMKNTSTGTTPTITANNFRVVKNGTTLWTGASNLFGTGDGAYSSNGLNDTDATWNITDMIQFQFNPTGLWRDVAVTILLELI